ncbi:HIT family protein [Aquicella lusitana]|uniref:Histidine triad (HIT) family protein n=1 Tax=Aquicella lusitana TaxID=254246 RepID=A0A370G865_9COXI|nr:HIT family protein [Aquicella lusitana]RDI39978.1 histidine triad (HIT) family protein [Aquicella lusitana]VVC74581.1 hypothetical protein AQULUS_23470 [Aquicella lusitana]
METCTFCMISAKKEKAFIVFEDSRFIAFLDQRPLFPGHCLLIPKMHIETFDKLPLQLIRPLFVLSQVITNAVRKGMKAEGTFIAINNRVSQSIPHLHIHIVPRNNKDGLIGFFWPRHKYESDSHMQRTQNKIKSSLKGIIK